MMKFNPLLIGILIFFNLNLTAQTVIFEKDVEKSFSEKKYGPNLKNFSHFYIGEGTIMGENSDSARTNPYNSWAFQFGYRYKLRINNFYSMGLDVNYTNLKYSLVQDSLKNTPNKILHTKERLNFYGIGLDYYNRFNFGRRGNHIGKFIDLGCYGNWVFNASNFFKDKLKNGYISRTTVSNLDYYNPLHYGILVRLGFHRFVLWGNYQINEIFLPNKKLQELPKISVGIQIGLHQ